MSAGYVKFDQIDQYVPKVAELLEQGLNEKQVANELSIDTSLVYAIMKSRKISKPKLKTVITPDIKNSIIEEYKSGGIRQIDLAKKYNISSSSICNILKKVKKNNTPNSNNVNKEDTEMGGRKSSYKKAMKYGAPNNYRSKMNSIIKNEYISVKDNVEDVANEIEPETIAVIEDTTQNNIDNLNLTDFYKYFGLNEFEDNLSFLKMTENVIEVGLVGDRHDMPIDNFIFDTTLDNDLLFDYDKQDRICEEYIKNNITFNDGTPIQKLVVYATGIQCALGAIIKACNKYNIELVLAHYNTSTKVYNYQNIFGNNDDICTDSLFNRIKDSDHGVLFYNCSQKDFEKNSDSIYTIKLCQFLDGSETDYKWGAVIVNNFEDIWKVYPTIVKYSQANEGLRLSVFINQSKISNGNFIWGDVITKSYNFRH